MAGFGDLMAPAQPGAQQEEGGTWSDLVQDPVARSALLGFGLQMMTGGWGNGTQQLAAGLGAGATSGAATSEALQKQLESEDKAASAEANQAANRANSMEIAKLNNASRQEIAANRIEGMLARTQMNLAGKSPDELKQYNKDRDFYLKAIGMGTSGITTPTPEMLAKAEEYATNEAAKRAALKGGTPGTPGASSPNGPVAPGAAVPGQSPGAVTGQNSPAQIAPGEKGVTAAMQNPEIQRLLSTPDGQNELKKRNPQAAAVLIERWRKANEAFGGANEMLKRGRTGQ